MLPFGGVVRLRVLFAPLQGGCGGTAQTNQPLVHVLGVGSRAGAHEHRRGDRRCARVTDGKGVLYPMTPEAGESVVILGRFVVIK